MFYIEYKDKQSGKTYQRYFRNKPIVKNAYCPHCGNQAMEEQWICRPISEDEIMYTCLHCHTMVMEDDKSFQNANEGWFDSITNLEVHEIDSTEAHAKIQVITNDNAMINESPVITPQPRNVRYTPEFLEKAAKAMRDIPLKRQNIHVHEDDMESTCPACGYMLYEEANMIFNHCPTCGQALNNNDFSEEDE